MYGLPPDFDAGVFHGLRLDSVTFGEYVIGFGFESGVQRIGISLESSFSVTPPGVGTEVPVQESDLMRHVGAEVIAAWTEDGGTLCLRLDDGVELRFFDDGPQYESYSITLPDGRRIVV
jgi:hypothetical protein